MGGDVTVTSEAGKGSTFTARLPGGPAGSGETLVSSEDGRSASADCILVIDDDATARELISDHLKAKGFAVVTAAGGMEGLRLAKELRPTAITLDVMMPDLDGWSVLIWPTSPSSWCRSWMSTAAASHLAQRGI
jgi:PleD family two-component response regulator